MLSKSRIAIELLFQMLFTQQPTTVIAGAISYGEDGVEWET